MDELLIYHKLITRRTINDNKMQLAIATNPQTKHPKELWNVLNQQERKNEGKDYIDSTFDQASLDRFKQNIARSGSKIAVKS